MDLETLIFQDDFLPSQSEGASPPLVDTKTHYHMTDADTDTERNTCGEMDAEIENCNAEEPMRKVKENTSLKNHGVIGLAKSRHFHTSLDVSQSFSEKKMNRQVYSRGEMWVSSLNSSNVKTAQTTATCQRKYPATTSTTGSRATDAVVESHDDIERLRRKKKQKEVDGTTEKNHSENIKEEKENPKKKKSNSRLKPPTNNKTMFDFFSKSKGV